MTQGRARHHVPSRPHVPTPCSSVLIHCEVPPPEEQGDEERRSGQYGDSERDRQDASGVEVLFCPHEEGDLLTDRSAGGAPDYSVRVDSVVAALYQPEGPVYVARLPRGQRGFGDSAVGAPILVSPLLDPLSRIPNSIALSSSGRTITGRCPPYSPGGVHLGQGSPGSILILGPAVVKQHGGI